MPSADLPGTHPYQSLSPAQRWSSAVAEPAYADVDPVVHAKFTLHREHRIVTAGSCFAQHLTRHLATHGFRFHVTEWPPVSMPVDLLRRYQYGIYSARYGNIYTATQLLQTLQRAYGRFMPADDVWTAGDGRYIDPYRPQIQPQGFASLAEFRASRRSHYAAIRRAVEELDVFIFTLGLTEAWRHRHDGAVYPVCPGVAGGHFDPAAHEFVNFGVTEVTRDLRAAIALVRERNPTARFILTVSPVALAATVEPRSVLVSTTYSKSVLRVAAEEVAAQDEGIAYLPSYEIITGPFSRGRYYAPNLREVTEEGVAHVMRLFFRHYCQLEAAPAPLPASPPAADTYALAAAAASVICEEAALGG